MSRQVMSYRVALSMDMGENNFIKSLCKGLGFNYQAAKRGERNFFASKKVVHNFRITKYNEGKPRVTSKLKSMDSH